jgi:hypothetical protein
MPKVKIKTMAAPKNKSVPYWNDTISKAIYERNKAKNKFHKSNNPADAIEYKKLRAIAQRTIRTESKNYWHNYCSTIDSSTKLSSVWAMAKRMSGKYENGLSRAIILPSKTLETNADKAEAFGDAFSEVSSDKNDSQSSYYIRQSLNKISLNYT